jgi:hypothetical protein
MSNVVEQVPVHSTRAPKRHVQRCSAHRLLRTTLVLPGAITVSAKKHRGRLVVRVKSPAVECNASHMDHR